MTDTIRIDTTTFDTFDVTEAQVQCPSRISVKRFTHHDGTTPFTTINLHDVTDLQITKGLGKSLRAITFKVAGEFVTIDLYEPLNEEQS